MGENVKSFWVIWMFEMQKFWTVAVYINVRRLLEWVSKRVCVIVIDIAVVNITPFIQFARIG